MEILRNLWRRKLRNFLTVSGIAIGILAFSTMGALAAKENALIDGGVKYFSDHISVSDSTAGAFGGGLINIGKVDQVKAVPGVAAVFATAGAPAKADSSGFSFGPGDTIVSDEPGSARYSNFKLTAKLGRIDNISDSEVVLGSDFAKELNKTVGDRVDLPVAPKISRADFINHSFTVIGIIDKTLTAPDSFAIVSLPDAQRALGDNLPPALRGQVDASHLVSGLDVYGQPGVNLDALAKKINATVPGLKAISPTDLVNAFKQFALIFSAIALGAALLALVVGGLSVVNTMLMSVTERYREIGLKKAVGARTRHILSEFLTESVTIGLIGGSIGLLFGYVITTAINAATAGQNLELFLMTPGLALGALGFSIGLGALAGVIPALSAARLDPVTALRSQ
ncbi:MAG TPA: FtsX-like permease family protein [Candidatus Dormibacteraeota bacterium]|jgi:putative ABC transport system permease protein|nr:FtsX-like permease family protein [Candidatus Dormibacteraeota bacterium]